MDGGATEVQLAGNGRAAELGLQQGLDRHSVSRCDVRVVGSHLGGTLQVAPCRTSNLSPPISNNPTFVFCNFPNNDRCTSLWEKMVDCRESLRGSCGCMGGLYIFSAVNFIDKRSPEVIAEMTQCSESKLQEEK